MAVLYRLHFHPRFRHAGHYVGYADDCDRESCPSGVHPACNVYERLAAHRAGSGAVLTYHAVLAGCRLTLVGVWPGTREDEARLKYRDHIDGKGKTGVRCGQARYCDVCTGKRCSCDGCEAAPTEAGWRCVRCRRNGCPTCGRCRMHDEHDAAEHERQAAAQKGVA